MKKILNKSLSLFLTLCMTLALLPTMSQTVHAGNTTNVTLPTAAGSTLNSGYVYTVSGNPTITAGIGANALNVASGASVVINIPSGSVLTVRGGSASGITSAGAGIYVPSNSTLIITGNGTLNATGGNAAWGGNGNMGDYGHIIYQYASIMCGGGGGSGGYGGGGAGAGIGGNGGVGGYGGAGGSACSAYCYPENTFTGYGGNGGAIGSNPAAMGTLYVLGYVTVNASGGSQGYGGNGGAAGSPLGNDKGSGWPNDFSCAVGGGGGGGGGGYYANAIGSGGPGAGGGGGGGGGGIRGGSGYLYYHGYGGYGGYGYSTGGMGSRSTACDWGGVSGSGGSAGGGGSSGSYASSGTFYKASTATVNGRTADGTASTHSAVQYTVTLDAQSGSGGAGSATATYLSVLPSITVPTRTGYTFGGYYTGTNGSGVQYYNASGAGTKTWDQFNNATLYAKWTVNYYTLTVTSAGNGSVNGGGSKAYGSVNTITATPNMGYAFSSWSDGGAQTHTVTMGAGNVAYTAYFTAIPAASAPLNANPVSLTNVSYGYANQTMSVSVAVPEGHTIGYQWYETTGENSGGTAVAGATGATLTIPEGKTPGTYYYYCQVTATRIGSNTQATSNSSTASFQVVNASQAAPSVVSVNETLSGKADGAITGVNTAMEYREEGGSYKNCPNGSITNLTPGTYYVRYKAKTYYNEGADQTIVIAQGAPLSVIFDNQGVGTAPAAINDLTYNSLVSNPGVLEATGYSFKRWYKDAACMVEWNFETDTVTQQSTTIYAKWQGNPYPVTNDTDGGTGGEGFTPIYGDYIQENIAMPTREGYTFGGYYSQKDGGGTCYFDRYGNRMFNDTWNIPYDSVMYADWLEQGCELSSFSLNIGGTTYAGSINEETKEITFDKIAPLTDVSALTATFDYKDTAYGTTTRARTMAYLEDTSALLTSGTTPFSYRRPVTIVATSEDGLHTEQYLAKLEYEGGVEYTLTTETKDADKDYNPGDTVTADIVATGAEKSFGSFQFDLDYDTAKLTLTDITSTLSGDLEKNLIIGRAAFSQTSAAAPIEIPENGRVIATATFKVNRGISTSETTISTKNAEMTMQGFDSNPTPLTLVSDMVNLHNITLTFDHDAGIAPFETATAYVRYNEAGLYTGDDYQTAFTYPAVGVLDDNYRLYNPINYWANTANGITSYYGNAAISARAHTENTTYTASSVELAGITVNLGEHGSFANFTAGTVLTVDKNCLLSDAGLPMSGATGNSPAVIADTGYAFVGWRVDDTDTIIGQADLANNAVTGNMTLTAIFEVLKFDWLTPLATNAEITVTQGVTNGVVTYGVPIKFTAAANDSYVITDVTFSVKNENGQLIDQGACALVDGVYEIDGTKILGDVQIEVNALQYCTVTFNAGEGNTIAGAPVTAYVVNGTSTLYSSIESLKAQQASDFAIPTPSASENYRLRRDTAGGEELWTDGNTGFYTSTGLNSTVIFSENTVLTARSVRQYRVTFANGENGSLTNGSTTEIIVDTGHSLLANEIPGYVANAGYIFDKWTWDGGDGQTLIGQAVESDMNYIVNFKDGKYLVTFALPEWVTVSDKNNIDADGYAVHGTDVIFKLADDGIHRIDAVNYTVSGQETKLIEAVDGVFTVPGNEIVADTTVSIEATQLYEASFVADENGTITGANTVLIGANETMTPEQLATVVPLGNTGYRFKEWHNAQGVAVDPTTITIAEPVTFKAVFELAPRTITSPDGVTISYESGYDNEKAYYMTDVTFTASSDTSIVTGMSYKVGDSEPVYIYPDENGVYTIPGNVITDDITLIANGFNGTMEFILRSDYKAIVDETLGKKILVLNTAKLDQSKYVLADGTQMYWSSQYNAYVCWVDDAATCQTLSPGLTTAAGSALEISYNGDVNGNGAVTAADAGIISDCLHDQRAVATSAKQLFELDVECTSKEAAQENGYKQVTTADITWILKN